VSDTPLVRRKQQYVLQHSGLSAGSHAYKSLTHIIETLPRDELFQATAPELLDISTRLLSLQESYPQLRSSEAFMKVQDELAGTENRLAVSRKDYNDATQDYNTTRAKFPTVISAKLFGFKEEPYFKAEEGATQVPKIDANSLRPNASPTK